MKKLNKTLIICESQDHGGKTKLCQHLIEKYRFNYYHCGVQPDIKTYHNDVLDMAFFDMVKYNSNFAIDRLHLSEYVYGTLFRDGPQYDWKDLDKAIRDRCKIDNIKYILLMCLPPKDIVIKGHAERNAKGDEMFNTVDKVYDMYNDLYEENKKDLNVYKYDFTIDSDYVKLDEYLESL